MILPAGCLPCPPAIAHVVRHIARPVHRIVHHVTRPFHHPVRHIAHDVLRHPGKIIVAACCTGAVGPGGGTVPAAPFNAPPAAYAPAPEIAPWPNFPSYSGGMGGIYGAAASPSGNAPTFIPAYQNTPPATLLPTQPAIATPAMRVTTNIPEPSGFALLLLPVGTVLVIRRRIAR